VNDNFILQWSDLPAAQKGKWHTQGPTKSQSHTILSDSCHPKIILDELNCYYWAWIDHISIGENAWNTLRKVIFEE